MAIKDQCKQCRFFDGNTCKSVGKNPDYNMMSCNQYIKSGINLEKESTNIKRPQEQPVINDTGLSDGMDTAMSKKQRMFERPFSFKGRIRRLEYGLSYILVYLLFLPINIVPEDEISEGLAVYTLLVMIPALWFIYAQGAKRCHDRGNSGWYQIIPFYGLWMLFGDGDKFENDYGPDPKGRNIPLNE